MTKSELICIAKNILSESKTAVLATCGNENSPGMRWMSPVFLRDFDDYIYALTSTEMGKIEDLTKNKRVQWLIQNKSLNRIITLSGKLEIIENVALKNEVLEVLGSRLQTFWKSTDDSSSLVTLETRILSGMLFIPAEGKRESISFLQEG